MTEQKYKHVAPCQDYLPEMQTSRHQDEVAKKTLIERIFAEFGGVSVNLGPEESCRLPAEIPRIDAEQLAEIRERFIYH